MYTRTSRFMDESGFCSFSEQTNYKNSHIYQSDILYAPHESHDFSHAIEYVSSSHPFNEPLTHDSFNNPHALQKIKSLNNYVKFKNVDCKSHFERYIEHNLQQGVSPRHYHNAKSMDRILVFRGSRLNQKTIHFLKYCADGKRIVKNKAFLSTSFKMSTARSFQGSGGGGWGEDQTAVFIFYLGLTSEQMECYAYMREVYSKLPCFESEEEVLIRPYRNFLVEEMELVNYNNNQCYEIVMVLQDTYLLNNYCPVVSLPKTSISLKLRIRTSFGQNVFVVGEVKELGRWNVDSARPLRYDSDTQWSVVLALPWEYTSFAYKYIVKQGASVIWESGENRCCMITSMEDCFRWP